MRILAGVLIGILGLTAVGPGLAQTPPDPLTVDNAVRIALGQNRAFLQIEAGVIVARGSKRSALSALLPSFRASGSWSKRQSTNTVFDFPTLQKDGVILETNEVPFINKFDGTTVALGADYSLSLQEWFTFRSSSADLDQSALSLEDAAQELAFTVRQQFYLVLRAQDLLTVQQEDLRLAQDEKRRVTSMFEVGSVARADVMKAKVRVSGAEVTLIQQENAVEIELTRLAVLLGYRADTDLVLDGDLNPSVHTVVDSSSAVTQSMKRADLSAARLGLKSAQLGKRAADFYWLPSLFANYNWSDTRGDSEADRVGYAQTEDGTVIAFPTSEPSEIATDGWSAQVGASINLDAFLFWSGNQQRAKGLERQRRYQLEGLELEAQRELEEAILNLRASERSIGSAQDAVASAEEDLRLSQQRYQQGLGTILELLESQVALTRARNQLVNALTGLRISEAAYNKARGEKVYR